MDIKRLIERYKTPLEAKDLIKKTPTMLLVGISGAGKDTIKHALLALPRYGEIISHTTRPIRRNEGVIEKDGVDYHFVSTDTAQDMLINKEFVEAKLVHGETVYGTSIAAVREAGKAGVALTDLDVQGVDEYKKISDDVIAIFIIPPSLDEWVRRLKRRYTSDEEFYREWDRRRQSAIRELEKALNTPYYRYVVNEKIDDSIATVESIVNDPHTHTRQDDEARIVARDILQELKM